MLNKLTPNLMVEDVNQTIAFYRDVLGFEVLANVPAEGQFDWAMLRRDEVTLMFQRRPSLGDEIPVLADLPIGGSLSLYTEVKGVKALYEQLKDRVEIVKDLQTMFYGSLEFGFKDCNGYVLVFSEPAADTAQ